MVVIKKYGNRRLYDTDRSRYVNLDELTAMIRDGAEVKVVDVDNGSDLTREILLQIVIEVLKGHEFLPTGFLRRVIRATGDDPAQRVLRAQIGRGLEILSAQMDQMEALFRSVPRPGKRPEGGAPEAPPEAPPDAPSDKEEADADAEMRSLRERLERLEARLRK